jgi:hypothetical protein
MPMPKLTCKTPYGTFQRFTGKPYTHVVIWAVNQHFAHSWHQGKKAAELAAKVEIEGTTLKGIFPVDQNQNGGN